MARYAIVTSHLTSGDAVSNDVVTMQRVLENHGREARLYAGSADFEEPKVWPLAEIEEFLRHPDDVLIYHHSFGWDLGISMLRKLKCKTIIKYHNVTPPEFFAGVSAWHEEKCTEGLRQLEFIATAGYEAYFSDSAYNMQQLLALGADPARNFVVPPFHHIDRLDAMYGDQETLETYRDGKTNILSVSRVAPHKNQESLIEAFAVYYHYYNLNSRLLLIGREEEAFETYSTRLRELISFLVLEDKVVFAGEVSDAALKAYYLLSNVFLIASKHEGFSVPLVEAMAMKVPIVSYGAAAVPETVGGAGVVLDELNPEKMAQALDVVVGDEATNVALGQRGWRRYEENFTNNKIESQFLRALNCR
jgi:glycosyltransferase involved in cell wall biosynthesis